MGQTVWNEFKHKEMSSAQADKFKYRKLQLKDWRIYPMGETKWQLIEKWQEKTTTVNCIDEYT